MQSQERLERDVAPQPSPASSEVVAPVGVAAILQLQRTAGNRAVRELIQRAPNAKAGDLDALVLRPGEKRKGLFAASSFAKLAKAVSA